MLPTDGDLSLYARHIGGRLSGLSGVYVDDTIQTGDEKFKKWTERTGRRFDTTPRKFGSAKFFGMTFQQSEDRKEITADMDDYIAKLSLAHIPCTFEVFRSKRAQLSWMTNCRLDVACAVSQCAQVTQKEYDREHDPRQLNRIIRHLKRHKVKVKFPQLDRKTLHIRAYSDASHANNRDMSSQLGIVVALCDGNNRCCIIGYRSYKCQRVTRSAMASECHAFADAFDFAFILKHDLETLLSQIIPIQMLNDNKSLFDIIVKASRTTERRLMIDVAACREAYEKNEIADIGYIQSQYNLADCMTKIMPPKQLLHVMESATLSHPIAQWIIRKTA